MFESVVHRTASSASPLSPRCANVSVKARSPDTRSAGCDMQQYSPEKDSPEDSSENRRMQGREGCLKPREKGQVLPAFSWACLGQFRLFRDAPRPPSLKEKSANLKKKKDKKKKFALLRAGVRAAASLPFHTTTYGERCPRRTNLLPALRRLGSSPLQGGCVSAAQPGLRALARGSESERGPFPWGSRLPGGADLAGRSLGEGEFCSMQHNATAMQHWQGSGSAFSQRAAVRARRSLGKTPFGVKATVLACRSPWEAEATWRAPGGCSAGCKIPVPLPCGGGASRLSARRCPGGRGGSIPLRRGLARPHRGT